MKYIYAFKIKHTLFIVALLSLSWACTDNNSGVTDDPCSSNFNQQAFFTNVADNIILPSYQNLATQFDQLQSDINTFVASPTATQLSQARASLKNAWRAWQVAAQYEFGPAQEVFLRSSINNFPLDIEATEAAINSNTYQFDQPTSFTKGLPAVEYLLYGIADNDDAVLAFFSNEDNTNYLNYLSATTDDMTTKVNQTLSAWSAYRTTFIDNTGTAAGTSLSLLVNSFNENYELVKREKLGIPSGVLTLGFTNPDRVEARYSGISVELATIALETIYDFYLGVSHQSTQNGVGLDDYLIEINALKGTETLDEVIKGQFASAIEAVKSLESPLSQTVDSDQASVETAYNEVTKQLVNIKTDMPSVLCVSITYIDNPSDSD